MSRDVADAGGGRAWKRVMTVKQQGGSGTGGKTDFEGVQETWEASLKQLE